MRAAVMASVVACALTGVACDSSPPLILETAVVSDTNLEDGPYEVRVVARDANGIDRVRLFYSAQALSEVREMVELDAENDEEGVRYRGLIDGQPIGTVVEFAIEACDSRGNCSLDPGTFPFDAHRFRVGLIPSNPRVDEIFPVEGPSSGGTRVEITGGDYRPGVTVFFDDTESPNVERVRADLLIAVAPPHDVRHGLGPRDQPRRRVGVTRWRVHLFSGAPDRDRGPVVRTALGRERRGHHRQRLSPRGTPGALRPRPLPRPHRRG